MNLQQKKNLATCESLFDGPHDHVEDMMRGPEAVREAAYRRGFQHGLGAAIQMIGQDDCQRKLQDLEQIVCKMRFGKGPQPRFCHLAMHILNTGKRPKKLRAERRRCRFTEQGRWQPDGSIRLYFIQGKLSGRVKIGISFDPPGRLAALQIGSGEELVLLGHVSGSKEDERNIHETFKRYRIHGEWFECIDGLKDFIDSVLEQDGINDVDLEAT